MRANNSFGRGSSKSRLVYRRRMRTRLGLACSSSRCATLVSTTIRRPGSSTTTFATATTRCSGATAKPIRSDSQAAASRCTATLAITPWPTSTRSGWQQQFQVLVVFPFLCRCLLLEPLDNDLEDLDCHPSLTRIRQNNRRPSRRFGYRPSHHRAHRRTRRAFANSCSTSASRGQKCARHQSPRLAERSV